MQQVTFTKIPALFEGPEYLERWSRIHKSPSYLSIPFFTHLCNMSWPKPLKGYSSGGTVYSGCIVKVIPEALNEGEPFA